MLYIECSTQINQNIWCYLSPWLCSSIQVNESILIKLSIVGEYLQAQEPSVEVEKSDRNVSACSYEKKGQNLRVK